MKTEISVSPLTVLADPSRIKGILDGSADLHPSAAYIIKKQLEESDIILITKTDLYPATEINSIADSLKENFPECEVRVISAKTGEGVKEWLDLVLTGENSGRHILDIDYDRYAEGEAVLGWLNCSASLSGNDVDWDAFTRSFMEYMASELDSKRLPVGHVKMIVENGDQYISANLTGRSETLTYRWSAGSGDSAEIKVNARVEMSPQDLEELFRNSLNATANGHIKVNVRKLKEH